MDLIKADSHPAAGVPEPDLNEAIALIYRAVGQPPAWRLVAKALATLFDADAVAIFHTEGQCVRILGEGLHNLSQEDAARLVARYSARKRPAAHHSGDATVHTVDDTGFTHGIPSLPASARVLSVLVPETDSSDACQQARLSVSSAEGQPPLSARQQRLRLPLLQHLTQAACSQRRLLRLQRSADLQSMVVLHLGEAWLVFDRDSRLVDCNPLARSFLIRSDLMRLRAGRVVYPTEALRPRLEEAMAPLWAGTGERTQVTLTSPERGIDIAFDFIPVGLRGERVGEPPDEIMVLVREIGRDLVLKIEAKAEAFRLSRAERRVMVHLVRSGKPPAAIALATGTSERTVRCQLSSIFRKTGAHNQQELIRMTLMR